MVEQIPGKSQTVWKTRVPVLTSENSEFKAYSVLIGIKKVTTKVKRVVYKEQKNNHDCACNNKIWQNLKEKLANPQLNGRF